MVLNLKFSSKIPPKNTPKTDWAEFGGDLENARQLELPDEVNIKTKPQKGIKGCIRYHRVKLDLFEDNTFFYGGWPQKKVPVLMQRKLNHALGKNQIRNNGNYYTLNGIAHQEYPFCDHLYVLITGQAIWLEVLPVKWILNPETKKAHSEQIIMADSFKTDNYMNLIGQQILYANKYLRTHMKDEKVALQIQKRELHSDLRHTIRTLRDIETKEGKISPEIKKIYTLLMKKIRHKKSR